MHLSSTHDYSSCTLKNHPKLLCNIDGCKKHHHHSIHGSTTTFVAEINSLSAEGASSSDNVLLCMQVVETSSGDINSFFDDGSTCCLILYSAANRLGLQGEEVTLTLETVNCNEFIQSKLFRLDFIDNDGKKAFGV